METLFKLALVLAALVVIYELRSRWTRRAAAALGLRFEPGPAHDAREPWRVLARQVRGTEPSSWGHTLHGCIDGADLALQEQELKPSVSSNREWHTLVVWTLPAARLPVFRLGPAGEGRGWMRQQLAPLADPIVRALGGEPGPDGPPPPGTFGADPDFNHRYTLDGPDPHALMAWFTGARCQAIRTLDPSEIIGSDGERLFWLRRGRAGPTQLAALLADAKAVREAFTAG